MQPFDAMFLRPSWSLVRTGLHSIPGGKAAQRSMHEGVVSTMGPQHHSDSISGIFLQSRVIQRFFNGRFVDWHWDRIGSRALVNGNAALPGFLPRLCPRPGSLLWSCPSCRRPED